MDFHDRTAASKIVKMVRKCKSCRKKYESYNPDFCLDCWSDGKSIQPNEKRRLERERKQLEEKASSPPDD